jgi:hypothetical protein
MGVIGLQEHPSFVCDKMTTLCAPNGLITVIIIIFMG